MNDEDLLRDGALQVLGRLPDSSNNALLCSIRDDRRRLRVVYKPVSGERPLWDFPDGTLCSREQAARVLDQALGWDLVPTTAWRTDGPAGPGIAQVWVEGSIDIGIFPPASVPDGWVAVVDAQTRDGPVVVAHRTDEDTMRMILFDAVANNADRKGGHLLRAGASLLGIDHGVSFHTESKLRTVLWGLAGAPVPGHLLADLRESDAGLDELGRWLTTAEVQGVRRRRQMLLDTGTFPRPSGTGPALPWPLI